MLSVSKLELRGQLAVTTQFAHENSAESRRYASFIIT